MNCAPLLRHSQKSFRSSCPVPRCSADRQFLFDSLAEFGRLRKTLFILRYMQDVKFRQAIEKQLNRGENSNKFSKAVAFGNNQEILFEEKEVAENCRQLI
jgi:TnpA family transposase